MIEFLHVLGFCHDSSTHIDVLDVVASYDSSIWQSINYLYFKFRSLLVLLNF